MTAEQLAACTGCRSIKLARSWLPHIHFAMRRYGIDTPLRQAAFLANVGHESGGLLYTKEIWGPTAAQIKYEGRADLGNTKPGDGKKFRGHGLIHVTGRFNHAAARDRMREALPGLDVPDFEEDPESLSLPEWAALSAGDFWSAHRINRYADFPDFDGCCDVVNRGRKTSRVGDSNGYAERLALYTIAMQVLA